MADSGVPVGGAWNAPQQQWQPGQAGQQWQQADPQAWQQPQPQQVQQWQQPAGTAGPARQPHVVPAREARTTDAAQYEVAAARQRDVSSRYLMRDSHELRMSRAPKKADRMSSLAGLLSIPVVMLLAFVAVSLIAVFTSPAAAGLAPADVAGILRGSYSPDLVSKMGLDLFPVFATAQNCVGILYYLSAPFALAAAALGVISLVRKTASGGSIMGVGALCIWVLLLLFPHLVGA